MTLPVKRIIIFAKDVTLLYEFYRRAFDVSDGYIAADKKWAELYFEGVNIAFHNGGFSGEKDRYPKIVFYAKDVEKVKELLINRGADMGRVLEMDGLALCNGLDPEGNVFQISNRE